MTFYGMSSETAQIKYYGKKQSYRASEGRLIKVPYKGEVRFTVEEILGGLRSTLTYAGAKTIKDLPKCTTFIKLNKSGNDDQQIILYAYFCLIDCSLIIWLH